MNGSTENTKGLPYTELEAGGKIYLLRLTARSAVRLEERLGMSVYSAAAKTDEMKIVSEMLYALIEGLKPEFTRSDTYTVIDEYISGGGSLGSLVNEIAEALRIAGFFGKDPAAPKNSSALLDGKLLSTAQT